MDSTTSVNELFTILTTRPGRSVSPTEFQLMDFLAEKQRKFNYGKWTREDDNRPMTVADFCKDVLKKPYIVKPQ